MPTITGNLFIDYSHSKQWYLFGKQIVEFCDNRSSFTKGNLTNEGELECDNDIIFLLLFNPMVGGTAG